MGINELLLVIAALAPAVFLCVYVYKKDRADKEPPGILALLLFLGVVIAIPAVILELLFGGIIDGFFAAVTATDAEGVPLQYGAAALYHFISCTLGVGLVEEGLKWTVLLLVTRKTRHFNSLFDGIIYAVFVSLGFAAFENVLYVLENGWINAVMRAVLSVPGHMFFAVLMGCYYSSYYMTKLAHQTEIDCRRRGILPSNLPEFSETRHLVLSLLVPTLVHGFYNFCLTMGEAIYLIAVLALVVGLYIYCFGRIKSTSRQDTHAQLCALKLLQTKYPGFAATAEAAPSFSPNLRFAGIYAGVPGMVHIVAPPKCPLPAGATLVTVQTPEGQHLPITCNVACQVEKYAVYEGQPVGANQLLGVLKYSG